MPWYANSRCLGHAPEGWFARRFAYDVRDVEAVPREPLPKDKYDQSKSRGAPTTTLELLDCGDGLVKTAISRYPFRLEYGKRRVVRAYVYDRRPNDVRVAVLCECGNRKHMSAGAWRGIVNAGNFGCQKCNTRYVTDAVVVSKRSAANAQQYRQERAQRLAG